jgi:hypothetical protein
MIAAPSVHLIGLINPDERGKNYSVAKHLSTSHHSIISKFCEENALIDRRMLQRSLVNSLIVEESLTAINDENNHRSIILKKFNENHQYGIIFYAEDQNDCILFSEPEFASLEFYVFNEKGRFGLQILMMALDGLFEKPINDVIANYQEKNRKTQHSNIKLKFIK